LIKDDGDTRDDDSHHGLYWPHPRCMICRVFRGWLHAKSLNAHMIN